ncbi:two-component system, NtrC family, sensor kinase [Candidatus Magnetomoraceae bacterium gMMP-15]
MSQDLISELQKANEILKSENKSLQEKLKEKTDMLVQSEKMASIGVIAAGVAHEINTPISFINSNLSVIKKYCKRIRNLLEKYISLENYFKGNQSEKIKKLLEEIEEFKKQQKLDFIITDLVDLAAESLDGTKQISEIVKSLKTFSRVDEAKPRHIDINETIESTLYMIWSELKYKTKIIKDYGDLPMVQCFPQKISQVFINLLMNAVQAIEEKGTIKIVTRHIKYSENDEIVEIKISDDGAGIPEQDILKIFDPFFTTKPLGDGTGLGLNISNDIIKAHGGSIKVESEAGKGTIFTISLPLN